MIEWVVIVAVAWLFACVLFVAAWPVFAGESFDSYLPSVEYAEDFAARLSGVEESPGSGRPPAASPNAEPGDDIVDCRTLGLAPRGSSSVRPTPADASLGRSAAEKDRPQTLYLVP